MGASPHVEIGELRPKCHLARITHLRRDPTSCVSLSSSLSSSFLFPIVGFGHAPFYNSSVLVVASIHQDTACFPSHGD
jgi:hypothetical protein